MARCAITDRGGHTGQCRQVLGFEQCQHFLDNILGEPPGWRAYCESLAPPQSIAASAEPNAIPVAALPVISLLH